MTTAKKQSDRDREKRHLQMRKRIMKAAMKLFLTQGYENVTMRNIASKIGYSPGTIYRYFANKDELFFALRGEGFELFYKTQMAALKGRDIKKRLRKGAEAYVDFALNNPEYYDLMFIMRAPVERVTEREEWAATSKSLQLLRDDVKRAIDTGLIKDKNADRVVFALWSLLHGIMALHLRNRIDRHLQVPIDKMTDQIVGFVMENLITAKKK